jgi:hypothetical protein
MARMLTPTVGRLETPDHGSGLSNSWLLDGRMKPRRLRTSMNVHVGVRDA